MLKVRDVLKANSDNICSISAKETAHRALQIIAQNDIGALIVTEWGRVAGIFSVHDCATKKILNKKSLKKKSVGELMTRQDFSISPEKSIEECKALMTDTHSSHLPVIENNVLIGIVNMEDVVKSFNGKKAL